MAFAARDLMINVFPAGNHFGLEMQECTLTSPTRPDDEDEPCPAPSCEASAQPPEEPAGDPAEPSGLATLRRQLQETLSAAPALR